MDNFWSFYQSMPTVTRFYITTCVLCTLGVQLDLLSPFQLYFNYKLIFVQHQYWRLITTFLFFGTFSFTFMFNIMFTYRYARMLEEGSFRSNSADFFFMLLFGAVLMTIIAPFVKLLFLGHAFTIMLVYVWAKRNTQIQLSLFGLFNFRAPHLPWILLGFSLILGNSVLTDVMGILVGHVYYYLQDVFPYLPGGWRCLKTPRLIVYLFNPSEYYAERLNSRVAEESRNVNNRTTNENSSTNQSESINENRPNQPSNTDTQVNRESASNVPTNQSDARSDNQMSNQSKSPINELNKPSISENDLSIKETTNESNKDENQTLRNRAESTKDGSSNSAEQQTSTDQQSNTRYQHEHLD